jgi:hypothetical protein
MPNAVSWKISLADQHPANLAEHGVAQQAPDLEFVAADGKARASSRCALNEMAGFDATPQP